jgi:beta-glucosidase
MSTKLTDKGSIGAIIREMSVEEKALALTGGTTFSSRGMEKYGIPSIVYLDCASGVNLMQYFMEIVSRLKGRRAAEAAGGGAPEGDGGTGSLLAMLGDMSVVAELTARFFEPESLSPEAREVYDYLFANVVPGGQLPSAFPDGMALGASWDPGLARRVGEAVGREAAAYGVDVLLGSPNVNIHRDPLNGRLFEGISEDPCLVSRIAPEVVKGVQAQGVGADVKHFAANNQETMRQGIDERVPARALHEIYFPGFKACVQDGKAMTVMSAYNKINGVDCAQNEWLLTDVLKRGWGFSGFVVSDWGAAYSQPKAFQAGNDVDMPGPRGVRPVVEAVARGELDESRLDAALERFLSAVVDIMGNRKTRARGFDRALSREAAYALAAGSMVLLKNEGSLLPLKEGARVCFFGDKSKRFLPSGEGSALVITDQGTSMLDEAAARAGAGNVAFGEVRADADVVVVTASKTSSEGVDHLDMELGADEKAMLLRAIAEAKRAKKKVVLVLNSGGPVETKDFIDDVDAFLWAFYPGMEGGRAAAGILFGDVNPSGKLPLTYPKRYKDCPTYRNFPGECGQVWYGEGIYVGYRYYDTKDVEPLYPFGHGLSYTSFEMSGLALSSGTWDKGLGGGMTATLTVQNVGAREGQEVVQLYIAQENPSLPKPAKELKAFQKVGLAPGESKEVRFELALADLESYNEQFGRWDSEPGAYRVLVGASSRDIRCEASFRLVGHSIYDYGPETQVIQLTRDLRAVDVFRRRLAGALGADEFFGSFGFMPYLTLEQAWGRVAEARLGKAEANALYAAICQDLREIPR